MAGAGRRFAERGFTFPKYLVPIRGRPILQWALESLKLPDATYHFVCKAEDVQTYALEAMLGQLVAQPIIHTVPGVTGGAALTALEAVSTIPDTSPLLIANCDQWLDWNPQAMLEQVEAFGLSGAIPVTDSVHPQMSYARVAGNLVTSVVEKVPVSRWATVGVYYFVRAQDFYDGVQRMVAGEKKVNGEYYVAPVYNELLALGKQVVATRVEDFWSLGTPEAVEEFRLKVIR